MPERPDFAPDWSEEERADWKRAYLAGEAVEMPHAEHDTGECNHCDLLRRLMLEADDD